MANYSFSTPDGSSRRATFPMHMVSLWLGQLYPTQVLVPAAVVRELIQFDFRTTIATTPELKGLTEQGLTSILNLLVKQFTTLDATDFESYLRATNISTITFKDGDRDRKVDESVIRELYIRMIRGATDSGLTSLYLRDALTSELGDFKIDSTGMTWSNLVAGLQEFQGIYGKLTQSVPGGELVPDMISGAGANPLLKFIYAIRRLTTQSTAPSIPARLSYVVDNIHTAMFGDGWVTKQAIIDGLEYRITPNPWVNTDLEFETAYLAYVAMLRTFMGFSNATESYNISPVQLANSLTDSMGQLVPAIPSLMKDKTNWSQLIQEGPSYNLIVRIWMTMVIVRMTSNEPSMTASRATSLMDFRKYRADEYTALLEDLLQVYGTLVDAYLDTAVFFRDLATSQRLFFSTHAKTRAQYHSFIDNLIKPYATFSTPQTSPRYIKEGAHVVTHSRMFKQHDLVPFLRDEDRTMKNPVLVSFETGDRKEWRHTKVLQGSLLNVKTPLTLSVYLQLATNYEPIYMTKMPVSNFLNEHDLFRTILGIKDLNTLITSSNIHKLHLTMGTLHYAMTESDFAQIFNLPYELAAYKFTGPGMYWKADSIAEAIFWIGGAKGEQDYLTEMNTYYVDEIEINDDRRLESFVAIHPFYLDLASEIGIDHKSDTFKTDLPANLEIAASKGKTQAKKDVNVPIQKEEDVPEMIKTAEDPVTSNQLEEAPKPGKKGEYRKGKSDSTKKVEALDGPPEVEPKTGHEWVQDSNSGKWYQKKK